MNRFYAAATRVLLDTDAVIDKLVGDEVSGLHLPFLGERQARLAVDAARRLLWATGHGAAGGPWLPVGVHTGREECLRVWVLRVGEPAPVAPSCGVSGPTSSSRAILTSWACGRSAASPSLRPERSLPGFMRWRRGRASPGLGDVLGYLAGLAK